MSAQFHKVSTLDTSLEEEVVLDHRTDLLGDKDNQYILDLEAGSKKEFTEPADDQATSADTMGGLAQYPLDYLMSDLQLFELVNAPTLLIPARRSFCNKQPILSGFMPSDKMDWRQYCEHAQQEHLFLHSWRSSRDQGPNVSLFQIMAMCR